KQNFADYVALDVSGGSVAFYGIRPPGSPEPVLSELRPDSAGTYQTFHVYQTAVAPGAQYTSPTVRVWVGKSAKDTALAYRTDNHIDAYPNLPNKLGSRFYGVARSPVIKLDLPQNNKTFNTLTQELSNVPSLSILHPVAYMPQGHDHSYPDF